MEELIDRLLLDAHWRDLAACLEEDPTRFFPAGDDAAEVERAKAVCSGCPVREECLAYAIETHQTHGIWGGRTPRERRRIRRRLREGWAA